MPPLYFMRSGGRGFAKDRAVLLESGGRTRGSGADEGVRPTESGGIREMEIWRVWPPAAILNTIWTPFCSQSFLGFVQDARDSLSKSVAEPVQVGVCSRRGRREVPNLHWR